MGNLKITVASDLGALGDSTSQPVYCYWAPWHQLNLQTPLWGALVVLGLLFAKPNRCGRAWWIWVALAGSLGLRAAIMGLSEGVSFAAEGIWGERGFALIYALAFGWLLAPYLSRSSRWGTYFLTALAMAAGGILGAVTTSDLSDFGYNETFLAVLLGSIIVGILLAGYLCRGGLQPMRFCLWLFASLALYWLLVAAAFLLSAPAGLEPDGLQEMLGNLFLLVASQCILALPFLLLSFLEPFYRARFVNWLKLAPATPAAPPPLNPTACGI